MKLAYVGHSHHQVTGSTRFVIDLLARAFEVTTFWDDSWLSGVEFDLAPVLEGRFDAVVVFQSEVVAARISRASLPNVTFFPMYDGCHALPDAYWRSLLGTKVVNFSSTLHEKLQKLGVRSRYVQYFPDPASLPSVDHSTGLSGYFWQRQQDITWHTVRPLLGEKAFQRFTLHRALDPSFGEFVAPTDEELERFRVRMTSWFPDRRAAAADLAMHNVYFAPRLREGIGMSFLEAMGMGFLVVAPDQPTMNEYIVSGLNGLLYDPARPMPLDFSRAAELGARARRTVELGHVKWLRCMDSLLEFVVQPTSTAPVWAPLDVFDPLSTEALSPQPASVPTRAERGVQFALEGGRRRNASQADPTGPLPVVTVAVVTRNAEAVLRPTLDSILRQDFASIEVVVIDGASEDGTLDIIQQYDDAIDWWQSAVDGGPYEAMNVAAKLARGTYLIFMNAGDHFLATNSLSLAFDAAPPEADVVFGHHVYRHISGCEEIRRAWPFEQTWADLREGRVGWQWLSRVPGHQATLTRTELVRRHPFRTELRIAADHDLLYRLAVEGACFHHCGQILATYVGGGLSWQRRELCVAEWRSIALEHTSRPDAVAHVFEQMAIDVRRDALDELSLVGLLRRAPRDALARATLGQLLRYRLAHLVPRPLRPAKRIRIEFGQPDVSAEIRRLEGLSAAEGCGRRFECRTAVIELSLAVRRPSRVSFGIHSAFGPEAGRTMVVRVGSQTFEHVLHSGKQTFSAQIQRSDRKPIDRIELTFPEPALPQKSANNEDARLLGVALSYLEIRLRP